MWLYSLVTGQNLAESQYKRHLENVIISLARSGGVVLGAGAHLVLARSGALRVRVSGSPEICAQRVAAAEGVDIETAKKHVDEFNHRRGKFVWDNFHARVNDPTTYDLIVNTDHIADHEKVVDMLMIAFGAISQSAAAGRK
jgi:cytidylate kinase